MPEFDLDSLKEQWQTQPLTQKYGAPEILEMLNKKSRNYVKYIYYISIAEFTLFIAIALYYILSGDDLGDFMKTIGKLGIENPDQYREIFSVLYTVMKVSSLLVSSLFVVRFYRAYKKIKVEENLKKFILQIVAFRKTVNLFILVNILLIVLFIGMIITFLFALLYQENVQIDSPTLYGLATGMIVSTILSVVLIWGYYRLVYGILMGRLGRNLKQLQQIENTNEN
ncbi:beta-carotene 15,15'-monooxygenase [Chryseobacterium sp. A321]